MRIVVRFVAPWLAAMALLVVACATRRPDGGTGLVPAGTAAPDFAARDAQGKVVRLSAFAGSPRVVYFYPKDETPGCTKEACAFRDAYEKYRARGVEIFGVSHDSQASHDAFRAAHRLPFPLAADEDGSVQRAYGVPSRLGYAARVSFLVGRDGKVEHVFDKVDPVVHADEVLALVK
jgi:thioredoxin-dependent peroxiredoxin